jgi:hypothetical protein
LTIAQLTEQVARPGHVIGRNAIAHELPIPAPVAEVDVTVAHGDDEWLPLECHDVAFTWNEPR